MRAPSFYSNDFDMGKSLKEIQQRCSQIAGGERCTEANCKSTNFAPATCPCSGGKRV